MPAGGIEKPRRSRITAACAVCRQKRQKCSGEKPVCDQCRMHNEECWWSDQKKRGPAKDYLRSLQDRLQETETLLLSVLGRLPDHDLFEAVQNGRNHSPSHQAWASSLSGQEYWTRYPLNRPETIRDWQRSRMTGQTQPRPLQQTRNDANGAWQGQQQFQNTPQEIKMQPGDTSPSASAIPFHGEQDFSSGAENQVPDWPQDPALQRHERYSEEARDVAQTLFSISNQGNTLPRGDQYQPPPKQALDDVAIAPDLDSLPSRFPKHLFW